MFTPNTVQSNDIDKLSLISDEESPPIPKSLPENIDNLKEGIYKRKIKQKYIIIYFQTIVILLLTLLLLYQSYQSRSEKK